MASVMHLCLQYWLLLNENDQFSNGDVLLTTIFVNSMDNNYLTMNLCPTCGGEICMLWNVDYNTNWELLPFPGHVST